jgi:hypothetical protein
MLIELENIQEEIARLNLTINKPKLGNYVTTTQAFNCLKDNETVNRAALSYIGDVIEGKADPKHIPHATPGFNDKSYHKIPDPELFWRTFEKYCHDMTVYVSVNAERKERLIELKNMETDLKYILGIDRRYY